MKEYNQEYAKEQVKKYREMIPDKFDHPGVYSIIVDDEIVYVGKARNMKTRIADHMYDTKFRILKTEGMKFKYGELRRALKNGYQIHFDILYTSSLVYDKKKNMKEVDDDIGPQEAKYINKYMPKLNKQIPFLDNYKRYKCKPYELLNLKEKDFKLEETYN